MYNDGFSAAAVAAKAKDEFERRSTAGFFVSSMLAGAYVGLSILMSFTIGGLLAGQPYAKIVMGIFFGLALALVTMAGAELFTGSHLTLTAGLLEKTVTLPRVCKLWALCFFGNWAGSIIVATLFFGAGIPVGSIGETIAAASAAKMALPPLQLLIRGALCNMFVCLGVWCSLRMKSESGKLIMIHMCLFAFLVIGFEHGIANMTVLTVGMLAPFDQALSWGGYFYNIVVASIGNMLGGIGLVALPYYIISRKTENK